MNLTQQLAAAAEGLYYISETDAPFLPFELNPGEPVEAGLRRLSGKSADAPVEIQEADYFFRNHTRAAGRDPEGEARAARFRSLLAELHRSLPDLKVYRVGSMQVDAYLLGRLPNGSSGGLRTLLVET